MMQTKQPKIFFSIQSSLSLMIFTTMISLELLSSRGTLERPRIKIDFIKIF